MTNDLFMNMGPVLLAFLSSAVLPISAAQIGLALGLREIMGAVTQPAFGWLSDRVGGKWLGAGGLICVTSMLVVTLLAALGGNFWIMLIPYTLMALGSGSFHPVGASTAAESDKQRESSNMAFFFLFGQFGLALGPLVAGLLLVGVDTSEVLISAESAVSATSAGFRDLLPIMLLTVVAIPGILLMLTTLPGTSQHRVTRAETIRKQQSGEIPVEVVKKLAIVPIILIVVLIFTRSMAHISTVNFIPLLFKEKGWSSAEYGLITSFYWMSSAISGVFLGRLADRIDHRYVISGSLMLGVVPLFLLPALDGAPAYATALVTGGLLGGSFSIVVVLAQHMFPVGRAAASGLAIGLTFGSGAVGSFIIGLLADGFSSFEGIGLESTFHVLAGIAFAAALLAFTIQKPEPHEGHEAETLPKIQDQPDFGKV
jgi:FSR family fosmidomycin resistance protein-like MFS transporter